MKLLYLHMVIFPAIDMFCTHDKLMHIVSLRATLCEHHYLNITANHMQDQLILYGTEGCHLCHDAQALLQQMNLTWQDIDIIEHDVLLERYGPHIPVLRRPDSGDELNWPFHSHEITALLRASPLPEFMTA